MSNSSDVSSAAAGVQELLGDLELKANLLVLPIKELKELACDHDEQPDFCLGHEWSEVERLIKSEERSRIDNNLLESLRERVRTNLIRKWIRDNLPTLKGFEAGHLVDTVKICLADDRKAHLRKYLNDVLVVGLKKANKNRTLWRWGDGGYFGHALAVLMGAIRIAAVFVIVGAASSKFETITFALLILIFNTADGRFRDAAVGRAAMYREMESQFRVVRRLLNERAPIWGNEDIQEQRFNDEASAARATVRYLINSVLIGMSSLVAGWKLVSTVLSI